MTQKQPSWTEKYRPKFFSDVKGQEHAASRIRDLIKNFPKTGSKAIILHGPPGIGKTTLAHVVKNETNSEIFELNASDLRNRDKLDSVLRPATEQKSLIREKKIILVDEVDGISEADHGGLSELLKLIENSAHPVIITANDIWDRKFSELRKKAEPIQLKEVDYRAIKDILIDILRREKKFLDNDILTNIALKSRGDVRAAINDLQTAVGLDDPSKVLLGERDKETDIFAAMRMIFKGRPSNELLTMFDSVNKPLDEIILWIEENIPAEYQGKELARAIDALSRVDIFRKRIYRQQYWRFLVYQNALLSYGVSSSKDPKAVKSGFTSYKKPSRILKMWMNNQRIEKKKSIAKKYAKYVHVGEKRALGEFATVKAFLIKPEIQKELKLTEDEIGYLKKESQISVA